MVSKFAISWSDYCLCEDVQGIVYPSDQLDKEVRCNRQPCVNAFVPPHLLPWVTAYTNPGDERETKILNK